MLHVRRSRERGHSEHGWLNSYHTFSFAEYHDPEHMGVSNLRVINEDTVAPGAGFNTHGHRDMEIISYVLQGALEHKDSMGNGSVIRPGDVQRMSAGTGVTHSEFNASSEDPVHFLQIWLQPNQMGVEPAYAQQHFSAEQRHGKLVLLVSPDGRDGSISTHQDGFLYGTLLAAGDSVQQSLANGRQAYVHVARGVVEVNGEQLAAGDGAIINDANLIKLQGIDNADTLVFVLP